MTRKLGSDFQIYTKTAASTSEKKYPTNEFLIDETRASCPAWLFRDVNQQRPQFLPINPQYNVAMPFENNQDTRFLEKDYYTLKH